MSKRLYLLTAPYKASSIVVGICDRQKVQEVTHRSVDVAVHFRLVERHSDSRGVNVLLFTRHRTRVRILICI